MNAFMGELGKGLAERWLALLVLPGALFVAAGTIAAILGQDHALDEEVLRNTLDGAVSSTAANSPAVVLAFVVGVLVASAAVGLGVRWLGWVFQRMWMAQGTSIPGKWIASWRRARWNRAYAVVSRLLAESIDDGDVLRDDLRRAMLRCRRISLVPAECPTWIGDRFRAAGERVYKSNRLDLASAWPRLWLVIPETVRSELNAAQDAYSTAARLAGWGIAYLLLGWLWWPSAVVAVATLVTAWVRARSAAGVMAELVEATSDLYITTLGAHVGKDGTTTGSAVGPELTAAFRKDDTIHP